MSVKMKKFLACRRNCARLENRLFDWVWLKSCWKPVKSYRTVVKGKNKGKVEVELHYPVGRKCIVPKSCMKYKERKI